MADTGRRLVFLDIDGVLNHQDTTHRVDQLCDDAPQGIIGVSPECVKALDGLIERTGAEIVVSSTWRTIFSLGQIGRMLRRQGFTHPRAIIDKTPANSLARGLQIQAWLDANGGTSAFVILDDDDDMAHLLHRLVRCNPYDGGLTEALAARATELLGVALG